MFSRERQGAATFAGCLSSGLHLIERALPWILIRPPAKELGAVAKPSAGEMIVLDFDNKCWSERLPFRRPFGGPAARPTGRVASEAGRLDQLFEFLCEGRLLG